MTHHLPPADDGDMSDEPGDSLFADSLFAGDFAFQAVARRADAALATLRIARGLAEARRSIDLAGLDLDIGRLCAAALDLAPEQGRVMRARLAAALAELDALAAALAPP